MPKQESTYLEITIAPDMIEEYSSTIWAEDAD